MTLLAKILCYTAYSINLIITILFIWNWDFRPILCISYIGLILMIPFFFRAIGILIQQIGKNKIVGTAIYREDEYNEEEKEIRERFNKFSDKE